MLIQPVVLSGGSGIPLNAGWAYVGAWDALWKVLPKDFAGKVA